LFLFLFESSFQFVWESSPEGFKSLKQDPTTSKKMPHRKWKATKQKPKTFCKDCKIFIDSIPQDVHKELKELDEASATMTVEEAMMLAKVMDHEFVTKPELLAVAKLFSEKTETLNDDGQHKLLDACTAFVDCADQVCKTHRTAMMAVNEVYDFMDKLRVSAPELTWQKACKLQETQFEKRELKPIEKREFKHKVTKMALNDDQLLKEARLERIRMDRFPQMPETQTKKLRVVDAFDDEEVWIIVDDVCNSCCHGEYWRIDAEKKFMRLGFKTILKNDKQHAFNGVGSTKTSGKWKLPMELKLEESGMIFQGSCESH
jgi:hypothetical protein